MLMILILYLYGCLGIELITKSALRQEYSDIDAIADESRRSSLVQGDPSEQCT